MKKCKSACYLCVSTYICTSCVCLYMCMFVHVYVCTCVCLYMCMCVHVYVCTCVCLYMCMCVHVYVCTCVCVYMCMFVHVYVCTCVCLYMCMFNQTCIAIRCFKLLLTLMYGLNEARDPSSAYSNNNIGLGLRHTPTNLIILG